MKTKELQELAEQGLGECEMLEHLLSGVGVREAGGTVLYKVKWALSRSDGSI